MKRRPLIRAIGILESCFKEKFATPRQPQLVPGATAWLRLRRDFIPAQSLKGLEEFSHVWLLSYFHLNTNKTFLSTVHPPRLQGKTVGVFASRSPHRPSPIGLSLARLLKVDGDVLHLAGIDLVDGTPILDVKPYIPSYDSVPHARAGWTAAVEQRHLTVRFSAPAARQVRRLEAGGARGLKALIADVLRHDPRNPRDKSQLREGKDLECFLLEFGVRFRIRREVATVVAVEPARDWKKARPVAVPVELLS